MHRLPAALGVLLLSCGGRSDLDVRAYPTADAAHVDAPKTLPPAADAAPDVARSVDAMLDAARRVDAPRPVDAGMDGGHSLDAAQEASVGACTTPVVFAGDCNIPSCCKFNVTWTCGTAAYSSGGSCQAGQYAGECSLNGAPVGMFNVAQSTCLCPEGLIQPAVADAGALGSFVQNLCDPIPSPPPPR